MEKLTFVKNGVLRLPPGFRFHPTDEELIVQYLKRKVFSHPFPASIIPEADICKSDPWDLPGDSEKKERYFFSKKEAKYPNGNRSNRSTNSGYWKATGIDKRIVSSKENQLVGMKKTLVFYRGKPPHGNKTNWIMHEFRLLDGAADDVTVDNWVLCRIFLKKRGNKNEETMMIVDRSALGKTRKVLFYNFMADKGGRTDVNGGSPISVGSCSSDSSGITAELPKIHDDSDGMEEISGSNTLMLFKRKPI
ncbi:NAC domain-containing protein 83-like [Impatiens glandulifera]|uniref:NAC domain-containing protein 83-like n=1 Tax=Impatiens glandulifera TaxID=253017 RepID=UPI001FB14A88|nr:NAC domain-containing protein 83-like [Impatiens glandulifera]